MLRESFEHAGNQTGKPFIFRPMTSANRMLWWWITAAAAVLDTAWRCMARVCRAGFQAVFRDALW